MKIGGLDIGTTGCKLTVFDENGKFLDKAYRSYPSRHGVGEHEIDASYIWEAVQEVMKEIARKYPDLFGFGITSFGETFVMTDEEGKPLCPSMLYTDPRGEEETEKLIQVAGDGKKIAAVTGLKPHSMYSLPKIMWMKEHRPDIYRKTEHIFLIADYIIYMLTGVRKIDYSLATRTMAFDIRHLTWSKTLLNAAGGNMAGATIAPDKTFLDLDLDAFKKVVELNLFGTVIPTQVFVPVMAKNEKGAIVNFCSESALRPLTRVVGYGAAKAAIGNYTKYMATELASKFSPSLRVNAIVPGFLLTNQNRALLTNEDGSLTDRAKTIIAHTPAGRFAEPEELFGTIHYLISDASSFVTGVLSVVDGGFDAFSI